jgi:alginate production protein
MKLAGYTIVRQDRGGFEGKPMLMGVRMLGTPSANVSHWAEGAILRGTDEQARKFDAYAIDVGYTYKWTKIAYSPNVTLAYAFATGATGPADAKNREFRQSGLHSNESRFAGNAPFKIYGEALDPELSNLHVLTAGLGFRPTFEMSLDFVAHRYYLDKIADEVRNSGITALMNTAGNSKDVGKAFDIVLGLRNMFGVKRLGLDFRAGWFFPGKAFHRNDGTEEAPDIRKADKAFTIVAKLWW